MKTLIILLLSFNSFSQDTIPCDMTRQQSRLYFGVLADRVKLKETQAKLFDDQHKRDNTKEIKSFRFQLRTFKSENKTIREQFKFSKDSLKRSKAIELLKERNRNSEKEKAQRIDINRLKTESKELAKQINSNTLVWWIGIVLSLGLVLGIVMRVKR